MLKVLDSEKQSRRWVEEKIKSYNPETEYAEIVSIMAQYQLDEFTLNFLVTILTSYTLKPTHMAETLSITNKGLRRPNQRMQDTLQGLLRGKGSQPLSEGDVPRERFQVFFLAAKKNEVTLEQFLLAPSLLSIPDDQLLSQELLTLKRKLWGPDSKS